MGQRFIIDGFRWKSLCKAGQKAGLISGLIPVILISAWILTLGISDPDSSVTSHDLLAQLMALKQGHLQSASM